MEKYTPGNKIYYLCAEVAELLDVPASTLRWWEREFPQLQPRRTKGGHRRYSASDVELLRRIKELVHDGGMSIPTAIEYIKKSARPKSPCVCNSDADALKILAGLRVLVNTNPRALTMIEAMEKYLRRPSVNPS